MSELTIRVLGPLEVCIDGRPVTLGSTKQRAVLAMLALAANTVVNADRLMDGLWGEHPPASASKNLQLYVSQLRKLLIGGGAEIRTRGRGYELRVEPAAVDAARVEELLDEPGAGRAAAALFHGRPLADLADEPFAAAAIRRLEELRLGALLQALSEDVEAGRHDRALPDVEALLAEQPLNERLHELRVLALFRAGRQADALDAFRSARAHLVEELGIEPGPALQELHARVLRQDPALTVRALPGGTLTLLFTDVEGSTRLARELGPRYPDALAEHHRRVRAAAAGHRAHEVSVHGDGFFFVFTGASDACLAAQAIHAALAGGPMRVRIGVHTGEPERIGDDYTGVDVHRAARVCAAAHGGQTVLSERTRTLLGESSRVVDLGRHRLRDLGREERLFQLGVGDFPPLRSLHATNLPTQPSPLVGRRADVERIVQLARSRRLVTLAGPGGSGKTRLALQAASELVPEFPDGVYWVPLAAVQDADLVPGAIAQVLGTAGAAAEHIGRQRMLLLLDNLEQVVDCASHLAQLLEACPRLALLATSRALLRIAPECVYDVEPMIDAEAVELFRERAAVAEPLDAVRAICRRLDRLPLAIELAAARTRVLPPPELLERLERALSLLTGGTREAPARQRTLRGAIEWSHDLLDDRDRTAFRRLAVFLGSLDADAAERVCGVHLDQLESLVEQSLLRRTATGRLFMLETIREFAIEQLERAPDADALRRAHAAYFAAFAEKLWLEHGRYPSDRAVRELEEFDADLRAAIDHAIAVHDGPLALRLAHALVGYWSVKNRVEEGARLAERALALDGGGDEVARCRGLRAAGGMHALCGRNDPALERTRASVALARELGDSFELANSLRSLALAVFTDATAARPAIEESLALARRTGDVGGEALSLSLMGDLLRNLGEHDAAERLYRQSTALSRSRGDGILAAMTTHSLGDLELDRGNVRRARTHYVESLRASVPGGHERNKLYCLAGLAAVVALEGDRQRAEQLWGAVEAAERTLGVRLVPDERERYERIVGPPSDAVPAPLDFDAAVELALA